MAYLGPCDNKAHAKETNGVQRVESGRGIAVAPRELGRDTAEKAYAGARTPSENFRSYGSFFVESARERSS